MSNSKPDVILKWDEYQRYLDLEEELQLKINELENYKRLIAICIQIYNTTLNE